MMNENRLRRLKETAKAKNKQLLIEESQVNLEKSQIQVFEKGKLVESVGGDFEALAVIKDFPISKYTLNENNRIYPKEEFLKPYQKELVEGGYILANHMDESDYNAVQAVAHNYRVLEDEVVMDVYLIEEKAVKILKAGGKFLGSSTVGYGNIEDGTNIVTDFEFDKYHPFDFVLNPSQGTYAEAKKMQKIDFKTINESITNKKRDITEKKQNEVIVMKMNSIESASFRNQVSQRLRIAEKSEKVQESLEDLQSLIIPDEMEDLKEKTQSVIFKLQEKLQNEVVQKELALEEKAKAFDELQEKYQVLNKTVGMLKEKSVNKSELMGLKQDLKTSFQEINALQSDLKTAFSEAEMLLIDDEDLKADIETLIDDKVSLEQDIDVLYDEMLDLQQDLSDVYSELQAIKDDLQSVYSEKTALEKDLKSIVKVNRVMDEHIKEMEEFFDAEGYKFEDKEEETLEPTGVEEDELDIFDEVSDFYYEMSKKHPVLRDFKTRILAVDSVKEAKDMVKNILNRNRVNKSGDVQRVKESKGFDAGALIKLFPNEKW